MADDLNEFLRQAALRREARKRSSGAPSQPSRSAESRRAVPLDEIEVVEAIPVEQRHLTPQIPPSDHLSGNVAKVDQKREAHLREAFGNRPVPLERTQKKKAKSANRQSSIKPSTISTEPPTPADLSMPLESGTTSASRSSPLATNDLLQFLRNPSSLRMAFIASEIFDRKFQ